MSQVVITLELGALEKFVTGLHAGRDGHQEVEGSRGDLHAFHCLGFVDQPLNAKKSPPSPKD